MVNKEEENREPKLELIATRSFTIAPELVYVVDFLNRSLKDKNLMFGIKKDREKNEMVLNIYEF